MAKNENRTISRVSQYLLDNKYEYQYTVEDSFGDRKGSDYYRSKGLRYIIIIVNEPLDNISPNIIIQDSALTRGKHDSTIQFDSSVILQTRINLNKIKKLKKLLKII